MVLRPHTLLEVFTAERTWDSYDLLDFVKALPWSKAPRMVVLGNASFPTSDVIRLAHQMLAGTGICLYFLPAYSPELNLIEISSRDCKEIVGAGQQQVRFVWANIDSFYICLWTFTRSKA